MDPLKRMWEQLQQQYRNYHASTQNSIGTQLGQTLRNVQSGASAVGGANPFNNQYFQALTHGNLTSQGIAPNAPLSPSYGNDLGGVLKGLLDRMAEYSASGLNSANRGAHQLYNKIVQ